MICREVAVTDLAFAAVRFMRQPPPVCRSDSKRSVESASPDPPRRLQPASIRNPFFPFRSVTPPAPPALPSRSKRGRGLRAT